MKKILLIILSIFITSFAFSQSAKEMKAAIDGKWEVDDNNNVTFVKVIDIPGMKKDLIYQRVLNYFIYNYMSGKSVIQTQDSVKGIIIGKGIYQNVHTGQSLISTKVDAWHILRVDIKDDKVRVLVTLIEYEKTMTGNHTRSQSSSPVSAEYPVNPKGTSQIVMMKAFYKTYVRIQNTFEKLEKAIKEGTTSKELEKENW